MRFVLLPHSHRASRHYWMGLPRGARTMGIMLCAGPCGRERR